MAFTSGFLKSDSLVSTPDGCTIRVQLPWMRSLPFSAVTDLRVEIDGNPVDTDALRVVIDHKPVRVADLGQISDRFWFIQERIDLRVSRPVPLEPGRSVTVTAWADLRMPYVYGRGGSQMTVTSQASKRLTVS